MLYLLILPFAFALLRLFTRKYAFSALTTVSAGVIALTNLSSPAAVLIACALFVSAVGDYFMAHRSGSDRTYALGIIFPKWRWWWGFCYWGCTRRFSGCISCRSFRKR